MSNEEKFELQTNELDCPQCGSKMKYSPGQLSIKCDNCGFTKHIEIDERKKVYALAEIDYIAYINSNQQINIEQEEFVTVACPSCGAETNIDTSTIATSCPFCATPLVKEEQHIKKIIKPTAVLPFEVNKKACSDFFLKWLNQQWFLPNGVKKYARLNKFEGIYAPFWTFDAQTTTQYRGKRGENYYDTETYTTSDGRKQTRTVVRTRWYNVSGIVRDLFDDILIVATDKLPKFLIAKLKKWDLSKLVPYDRKVLAGFKALSYTIKITQSFEEAKQHIEEQIIYHIRRDIGGDQQIIDWYKINFDWITFKHILLPIWISSFVYKNKVYNFVVNGQTGEISGQRPYSILKIILFVLFIIGVIIGLYYLFGRT